MKAKIKSVKFTCPNCMFDFVIESLSTKSGKCPTCRERVKIDLPASQLVKSSENKVSTTTELEDFLNQLGYNKSDYEEFIPEVVSVNFQLQQIVSRIIKKYAQS
jgi:hypothetical protein